MRSHEVQEACGYNGWNRPERHLHPVTLLAPFLADLKKPELKIPHTVNFYIKVEPRVILGIWHTVPSCRGEDAKGKGRSWYEAALHDGNPIIVYLHGSAEHRTAPHRLEIVKVLSDGGFHVSSVDYRGFGDSTGKLMEEGLTSDTICVYEWTKARSGTTPVCLWGHSLGTGVTTNAAKVLEGEGFPVDTIILEAPFTNIWVASINYPLLKIYRKLPGFLSTVMDALRKEELVSLKDENVKFLSSPLLIIHGLEWHDLVCFTKMTFAKMKRKETDLRESSLSHFNWQGLHQSVKNVLSDKELLMISIVMMPPSVLDDIFSERRRK
ncbi:hypothetical protein EI555_013224 [Monodon monoceros]|uniref:Serine aminopeptidase S33 domain-containing protein n=1 Tax=Monodon monoceros TaxID=40151 RepID=A0A4U1FRF3_MONMO|nr:hypothetical protein EI555_013224 [Monodon monoceros]